MKAYQTSRSRSGRADCPGNHVFRLRVCALLVGLVILLSARNDAQESEPVISADGLGPNTTVLSPDMPIGEIQTILNAAHAQQVDDEMDSAHFAYLFKPSTYGTDEESLQIRSVTTPRFPVWARHRATSSSTAKCHSRDRRRVGDGLNVSGRYSERRRGDGRCAAYATPQIGTLCKCL